MPRALSLDLRFVCWPRWRRGRAIGRWARGLGSAPRASAAGERSSATGEARARPQMETGSRLIRTRSSNSSKKRPTSRSRSCELAKKGATIGYRTIRRLFARHAIRAKKDGACHRAAWKKGPTLTGADFLVELRGFEPMAIAVSRPRIAGFRQRLSKEMRGRPDCGRRRSLNATATVARRCADDCRTRRSNWRSPGVALS
jgi:hypothetical protein